MKKFLVIICASFLIVSCGGAGTNSNSSGSSENAKPKIEMTLYGKTRTIEPKTGLITVGQTGSDEKYGEYTIFIGTTELKTTADLNKPIASADDVQIMLTLARKKGTDKTTPAEVETFPVNGSWPHINDAQIKTFDGNRVVESWGHESPSQNNKGAVKITAVKGDMVTGEVDLTYGDKIKVKGTFTARVQPPSN